MIFVDRSAVPVPDVLFSKRANAERERITKLLRSSDAHLAQLRITFQPKIWLEAKGSLLELFHGKCAFCETRVDLSGGADIEHFRPKQGAQNINEERGSHLHYAWLSYEWENLLLACMNCSRRRKEGARIVGKGTFFPVAKKRASLLASIAECREQEVALLIDPTFDQPAEHLEFDEIGNCWPLTRGGELTVELLALNRKPLVEARSLKWKLVVELASDWVPLFRSRERRALLARRRLVELLAPDQEYLAPARGAFKSVLAKLKSRTAISKLLESVPEITGVTWEESPKPIRVPRKRTRVALAAPRRFEKRAPLPLLAHQRIRRIEIRNFKAIEKLDFDLVDPTGTDEPIAGALMLLGENASGKSTVLEAVSLALLGTTQIRKLKLPAEDFIRRTDWSALSSNAVPAEVRVFFEGTKIPVSLTIDPKNKKFVGNEEPSTVLLAYGPRRFFSDERGLRRSQQSFARVQTLFDPLAVITNPNGWLVNCDDGLFNPTVRALRQLLVLPDEALVGRPLEGERMGAEIMFEVQGISAPLRRLSEGYKTIVATGVDIMREMLHYWPDLESARGVVLIDELETHLHPRWKMRIVQRLRKAMPQVQFLATTHDPLCLRGMYDGEVQVLARDEEQHIERLTDVPNVRGLSVEQLLMSDYFGLYSTEDPAIEDSVISYVALATKRNRSPEDDAELARQRQIAREQIVLGDLPQTQAVQEALSQYLLDRRMKPAGDRAALKQDTINRVVDLWKSVDAQETTE